MTTIPIFYACDDNFVKFTIVSIASMIENASPKYNYHIHILHTDINEESMEKVYRLQTENFKITFDDVTDYLKTISDKLPLRDYYSKTTYYRLFIAEMFPELNKAIYIDSDTVVQGDISKFYNHFLGKNLVGACNEQAMVQVDGFGTYAEKCVGVDRNKFFNAGVLLINCKEFRRCKVLDSFVMLLHAYNFAVTQDEDYLNVICQGRVKFIDQRWNMEVFGEIPYPQEEFYVVHYIMVSKPWHYSDCRFGDIFWKYAKKTEVYQEIKAILDSYTDEERARDAASADRLLALAIEETNREDNYLNRVNMMKCDEGRLKILEKISQYEKEGRFDEDVEDDPPSRELMPDEVDYLRTGMASKFKSKVAFMAARTYLNSIIRKKQMIVKDLVGIENFDGIEGGAVLTCNHFNALDSFAIQLAYENSRHKHSGKKFYRIIREGNYTSFPGFYGFLMRNCNTLPLSSNINTMKEFSKATDKLLQEGNFILIYPEQSMWWNYRKPKPLKKGGFTFAARNNVPVLPCFITMHDSEIIGDDGFPVQEYTIHICKPIYPDPSKSRSVNVNEMMQKNYDVWKELYEKTYGIPLEYDTE